MKRKSKSRFAWLWLLLLASATATVFSFHGLSRKTRGDHSPATGPRHSAMPADPILASAERFQKVLREARRQSEQLKSANLLTNKNHHEKNYRNP